VRKGPKAEKSLDQLIFLDLPIDCKPVPRSFMTLLIKIKSRKWGTSGKVISILRSTNKVRVSFRFFIHWPVLLLLWLPNFLIFIVPSCLVSSSSKEISSSSPSYQSSQCLHPLRFVNQVVNYSRSNTPSSYRSIDKDSS
jgi:hypothetical protein